MPTRSAHAEWNGAIDSGSGRMSSAALGSVLVPLAHAGRRGHQPGGADRRRPRGLLLDGAVGRLGEPGHTADSITTDAKVKFEQQGEGWAIAGIELTTVGKVPGIDEDAFVKAAEAAKENCPVSVALKAVDITLNASLEGRLLAAGEDGVLVRVRGGAAAEQDERLGARVEELVHRARRDDHAVAAAHGGLVVAEPHRPRAREEEVDLLGDAVVVLGGLATRAGPSPRRVTGWRRCRSARRPARGSRSRRR